MPEPEARLHFWVILEELKGKILVVKLLVRFSSIHLQEININIPNLHMAPSNAENANYIQAQRCKEIAHESKANGNDEDAKVEKASMHTMRSSCTSTSKYLPVRATVHGILNSSSW